MVAPELERVLRAMGIESAFGNAACPHCHSPSIPWSDDAVEGEMKCCLACLSKLRCESGKLVVFRTYEQEMELVEKYHAARNSS